MKERAPMLLAITFIIASSIRPDQVYQHAHVPVLIPSVLHAEDANRRVYEYVESAERGTYKIRFDGLRNCFGAGACYIGFVSGGTKNQFSAYHPAQSVRLQDGTPATFVPFGCGGSCGDSQITFRWHGYYYLLALKAATETEMLRAANSMLPH